MIRTFISLTIPNHTIDQIFEIIKNNMGNSFYDYRWIPKKNLHITLKFIGEIEEAKVETIINALSITQQSFGELTLEFSNFGFFEKNNKPAIFWIDCNFSDLLLKFVQHIEESLAEVGFAKEERKFKSHLTLIRLKEGENIEAINKMKEVKFEKISFKPETIALMKSELTPKGSKYFVIKNLVI